MNVPKIAIILTTVAALVIVGLVATKLQWQQVFSPPTSHWIAVPYSSQSPDGVWAEPWENACEETTITMLNAYYKHDKRAQIPNQEAKDSITAIINWEKNNLGFAKDTGAADTKKIIDALYKWEAKIIYNPSLDSIKNELYHNRPVVLLVHGTSLKNPHFVDGGPNYHMLLAVGYDDKTQEFITHEPGMNNGQDFRYPYATIMTALHDYVADLKTETGTPVVLFTHSWPKGINTLILPLSN
mgnify:CR=1 FL=1